MNKINIKYKYINNLKTNIIIEMPKILDELMTLNIILVIFLKQPDQISTNFL